jgi:site-specific DNA-cytosine methylase
MRSSRLIFRLVPSALPIEGTESGLLPTPSSQQAGAVSANDIDGELQPNKRMYSKRTGKHMQITLNRYVGLWPTPNVAGLHNRKGASATSGDGLSTAVKMWPTPTQRDWKDTPGMSLTGTNPDGSTRDRTDRLAGAVYAGSAQLGSLNPDWVERLMGFPVGWTDLSEGRNVESIDYRKEWVDGSWEDGIPRTAFMIPNRAKRLKQLGNAVVPQVVEMIGRAIQQAEEQ